MDGSSDKGAPRSKEFDDVYFSAQNGLAETRHVFLQSNYLPAAWLDKENFVIAETGFGTGLNFLATWKLYQETGSTLKHLHFISFEKYPLTAEQINEYLEPFRNEFPDLLDALVDKYPFVVPGFHRIDFDDHVSLTLIFDDVNEAIPKLGAVVDCWFLDGFRPSSNPEMWSETLFANMARLSRIGTRFATFTAAGFVKRGLRDAGFVLEKIKGYGRKREMLVGQYQDGGET